MIHESSIEQKIANLRAWIAAHAALPYEADDSRESIYEESIRPTPLITLDSNE